MSSRISITTRLRAGLSLLVFFFIVQATYSWYSINEAKSSLIRTIQANTLAIVELDSLGQLGQQIRRYEKEYFIYVGNIERRNAYEREWRDTSSRIETTLARLTTNQNAAFSAEDVKQAKAWKDASAFYAREMQKIFTTVIEKESAALQQRALPPPVVPRPAWGAAAPPAGPQLPAEVQRYQPFQPVEVNEMIKDGKNRFSAEFIAKVADMQKRKSDEVLSLSKTADTAFISVLAGLLATVAIGAAIAFSLALFLPRLFGGVIRDLSISAHQMSIGNLGKPYNAGGIVEFQRLAEALERMRVAQQVMIDRLRRRT